MTTFELARKYGGGALLKNPRTKEFFKVSDWSNATADVYGWPVSNTGERLGRYQQISAHGLELG